MALKTFLPPVGPSPGTAIKPTIKILEAEFGDGYTQPTPNGLNNIRDTLTLSWGALTDWQKEEISLFLRGQRGTIPFYYQPVGDSLPRKWSCKEWDIKTDEGIWMINATLIESFTLEV